MAKPMREAAITALFSTARATFPVSLAIASLGCSYSPNTLFAMSEITSTIIDLYNAKKHELPEFQVFLNDLPGYDFNTIFSGFLPRFLENMSEQMKNKYRASATLACFFNGVPGSFYGRLFTRKSLHTIHSSYSLHWLSQETFWPTVLFVNLLGSKLICQVPQGLEGNRSNIYIDRSSPPGVIRAYYKQFQRNFLTFLECHGQELVVGGCMVLTLLGRRSDDFSNIKSFSVWDVLAIALNQMVTERLVEEEKLDTFNVPYYTPSPKEIRWEVQKQGSFSIDCLEVFELDRDVIETDFDHNVLSEEVAYNMVGCARAVAEPLVADHFGEEIIDGVFKRFKDTIADRLPKAVTTAVNIVISLKKIT